MSTITVHHAPVSHAPSVARLLTVHPITGQVMSPWSEVKSTCEEDRRETVLSGRLATSGLGVAGRAYAREMVMAGDCGYRTAVKQAREIFDAE